MFWLKHVLTVHKVIFVHVTVNKSNCTAVILTLKQFVYQIQIGSSNGLASSHLQKTRNF